MHRSETNGIYTGSEFATFERLFDEQRNERDQRSDVHEERKGGQRDDHEWFGDQSLQGSFKMLTLTSGVCKRRYSTIMSNRIES